MIGLTENQARRWIGCHSKGIYTRMVTSGLDESDRKYDRSRTAGSGQGRARINRGTASVTDGARAGGAK